jgi:hypothetical protein
MKGFQTVREPRNLTQINPNTEIKWWPDPELNRGQRVKSGIHFLTAV